MNRLTKAAVVAIALSTTAVPMLVQAQDWTCNGFAPVT